MVVASENARLSHRPPFRGCGGGGAAALPRRRPRRRASASQWKDTRAGVAQAALPDENLGSLLVHAAARYRIGSGGRTAGLARVAHGRSLCESLRALDRETYRRLRETAAALGTGAARATYLVGVSPKEEVDPPVAPTR